MPIRAWWLQGRHHGLGPGIEAMALQIREEVANQGDGWFGKAQNFGKHLI